MLDSPPPPHPVSAVDRFLDRIGVVAHLVVVLAIYAIAIPAFGIAGAPAAWLLHRALAAPVAGWLRWPFLGLAAGAA